MRQACSFIPIMNRSLNSPPLITKLHTFVIKFTLSYISNCLKMSTANVPARNPSTVIRTGLHTRLVRQDRQV